MEIPTRNTIFLQGVFFDEIKTIEERMIDDSIIPEDETNNFMTAVVTIPKKFKSIVVWKERTKNIHLKCWNCDLSFFGTPCFIPKHIKNSPTGKEFDTEGWFCGFACAYAYLKNTAEYHINKTFFDRLSMLKILFTYFYKRKVREFYEAPKKYLLFIYGGYIEPAEYKEQLKQVNKRIIQDSTPIDS